MLKTRLDNLLVEKKFVESRSKAQALILAGKVFVNDVPVDKVGALVKKDAAIRLKNPLKYVSRGGLKLEKALQEFNVDVTGKICLDVGASTGGFTDCLLQHGAKKVYAVDVGTNELHWKLEKDARVVNLNKENFRHLDVQKILDPIDITVMDVSFISVMLLIPKVLKIFGRAHSRAPLLIILIKPQFELSPEEVGKGGIVRDEVLRQKAVKKIETFCLEKGFQNIQTIPSPITGRAGNVEFLLKAEWKIRK